MSTPQREVSPALVIQALVNQVAEMAQKIAVLEALIAQNDAEDTQS